MNLSKRIEYFKIILAKNYAKFSKTKLVVSHRGIKWWICFEKNLGKNITILK